MKLEGIRIPKGVEEIFVRLSDKYSLEFEKVAVRSKHFNILHVKDLEPLVSGQDVFANTLEFPFWVKIWEAAVVLANWIATVPPNPNGQILELGAGLGVAGMVAAAFGHKVVITDYQDEILDFVRVSAAVNGCSDNIRFEVLDWLKPKDLGQFDMLLGSEILFHEMFFSPLLSVFERYLAPDGAIYMAHDSRRKSLARFLPLCQENYTIGMNKYHLSSKDENYDILLTRLMKKKA